MVVFFDSPIDRADRKSQVRQCLDLCTAVFCSLLAYESAEQKPKHFLTWDFLSALPITSKFALKDEVEMYHRSAEIERMMFAFGDAPRALTASAALVEEIVHSQVQTLLIWSV